MAIFTAVSILGEGFQWLQWRWWADPHSGWRVLAGAISGRAAVAWKTPLSIIAGFNNVQGLDRELLCWRRVKARSRRLTSLICTCKRTLSSLRSVNCQKYLP